MDKLQAAIINELRKTEWRIVAFVSVLLIILGVTNTRRVLTESMGATSSDGSSLHFTSNLQSTKRFAVWELGEVIKSERKKGLPNEGAKDTVVTIHVAQNLRAAVRHGNHALINRIVRQYYRPVGSRNTWLTTTFLFSNPNMTSTPLSVVKYLQSHQVQNVSALLSPTTAIPNIIGDSYNLANGQTFDGNGSLAPLVTLAVFTLIFSLIFSYERRKQTQMALLVAPLSNTIQAGVKSGLGIILLIGILIAQFGASMLTILLSSGGHEWGNWTYPFFSSSTTLKKKLHLANICFSCYSFMYCGCFY